MAKRFRFRLQAVENVRKQRENEQLRLLALAQRKYQEALQHRAILQNTLDESLVRREKLGENSTPILVFQIENENITGLKQNITKADLAILRTRKGVEKALREFLNARRQTRAIEILREKDFAEFKTMLKKKEQKELEDLYVMRAQKPYLESEVA